MQILWDSGFTRSYKKLTKRNSLLKEKINETIILLELDPYDPILKSHKLSGNLDGLWSCSVGYDCRIVFEFLENNSLLLIAVGSHDNVY